jgi:hypothetical protein
MGEMALYGKSLLKARCTGRQRNQDAEVPALVVLSLATWTRYKSGQWVNRTDLCIPSSSTARHARNLSPGDRIKGELCGSNAEIGEGERKIARLRHGGTRAHGQIPHAALRGPRFRAQRTLRAPRIWAIEVLRP